MIHTDATWSSTGAYFVGQVSIDGNATLYWFVNGHGAFAAQAGASAILLSIQIAKARNRDKVIILSDAQKVIPSVLTRNSPHRECVAITEELHQQVSHVATFDIYQIPRKCIVNADMCKQGKCSEKHELCFFEGWPYSSTSFVN